MKKHTVKTDIFNKKMKDALEEKYKKSPKTDTANKKMKESLKTIDEAKAREKKTSVETKDLGQDTGEKNINILQMVFDTQDTFKNDSFVTEPLESVYKQSHRSLHNIGNQNFPDNDSSEMDLQ